MIKRLKWTSLIAALLYIALGVVLVMYPETTARTLCYLLAALCALVGLVTALSYLFRKVEINYFRNDLVLGILGILLGCFIYFNTDLVISLVPALLGLCVLISGLIKLQDALDVSRMGYSGGWGVLALAVLNLTFGIVLLINPFDSAMLLFRLMGIALIFSGASDLFTTFYIAKKLSDFQKAAAQPIAAEPVQDAQNVRDVSGDTYTPNVQDVPTDFGGNKQ